MRLYINKAILVWLLLLIGISNSYGQATATVSAKTDANQITVGDQVRLFIEAHANATQDHLQWATIPDTFNHLEVVEKGKIDTLKQGDQVTYKQRLLITGFDSGVYQIPAFTFSVTPASGSPYTIQTDSFNVLVQTVQVDTTKGFKPIKGIIQVKTTWVDYLIYIACGIMFIVLIVAVTLYFIRNKKHKLPEEEKKRSLTLQERTLMDLDALEHEELWQKGKVKEYYTRLTDIIRSYIEARFHTPALELTTDELLYKAKMHRELQPYQELLSMILTTADLAKFAKAEPLPQEHTQAMDYARQFVITSEPIPVTENTTTQP